MSAQQAEILKIDKHPKMQSYQSMLQKMVPQFKMVLPSHVRPETFYRTILTTLNAKPELMEADPKSLLQACMTCAQLGLDPNPSLGQAWFVPYKEVVTFIPGYKGFIALARNSGEIASLSAQVVRNGDFFEYEFGLNPKLVHRPAMESADRPITHTYAVVKYKNGENYFDVMTIGEVENIRQKAMSKNSPAWRDYYSEMVKKTVIRRIAKFMPLSVQKAVSYDEAIERGARVVFDAGEMVVHEPPALPASSETSRLDALMDEPQT